LDAAEGANYSKIRGLGSFFMARALFRVHGVLEAFLPRARRGRAFEVSAARAATWKNAIEAAGVPHTEVGTLSVNGAAATLERIVREGDSAEIGPWVVQPVLPPGSRPCFVADAHLGGLARFLRMLGYDTLFRNDIRDDEIRSLAAGRIVLSRDRELLKCREVLQGAYVHARRAGDQLAEVARRFALAADAHPFSLCLVCNRPLEPVSREEVLDRLPDKVAAAHRAFHRCRSCGRIYWAGSHHARMSAALERIVGGA
jgi:uncharacterized protein with PIN domain